MVKMTMFDIPPYVARYLYEQTQLGFHAANNGVGFPRETITSHGSVNWIMTYEVTGYTLNELPNVIWSIDAYFKSHTLESIHCHVWSGPQRRTEEMLYQISQQVIPAPPAPTPKPTPENYGSW